MGGAVAFKVSQNDVSGEWAGVILQAPMCKIAEEFKPPQYQITVLSWLAPIFPTWQVVPTEDVIQKVGRVRVARIDGRWMIVLWERKHTAWGVPWLQFSVYMSLWVLSLPV